MENVKEEPEQNSRIAILRPETRRKSRFSTASFSKPKSVLRGKSGLPGKGNAKGKGNKDTRPVEIHENDQCESSPKSKTETKKERSSRRHRTNSAVSLESMWSDTDKQRLLIALQRFGVLEIDELIKSVPGKSEDDIRKFITHKWKTAHADLKNVYKNISKYFPDRRPLLGLIDGWIEVLNSHNLCCDNNKTSPLARAVLLIWEYEKHPKPSECGGIDFKALYEHLYYLLAGYPPRHLNQPTALYLRDTVNRLFCSNFNNGNLIQERLNEHLKINTQTRSSVTEEDIISSLSYSKEKCLEEILKVPECNPFSVPKVMLQKKVSEDIEETITAS